MSNPDYLIHGLLDTSGIDTSYTASLHVHPIKEKDAWVKHKAVFIILTGESNPVDYLDASGEGFRRRRVQIICRSDPGEYAAGQTLTFAVRDVLHLATLSGKVGCRVFSGPWLIEKDNQDRYVWSMNVEVTEVS